MRAVAAVNEAVPFASVIEVGSTAVEGVIGKQDIDILVLVPREDFSRARLSLDRHFVRNPAQLSNESYQGYVIRSELDVAIQLTVAGSEYDKFERFLFALRSSPQLRAEYNQLKRLWDGRSMKEYQRAKAEFVESALLTTPNATSSPKKEH